MRRIGWVASVFSNSSGFSFRSAADDSVSARGTHDVARDPAWGPLARRSASERAQRLLRHVVVERVHVGVHIR